MELEEFKNKYEKVPVEHYPNEVDKNPLVSVCVQTYNHAPFIKECLEGILKQQIDFPIEILLGEDASNDDTREICIEYAKEYPHKIRLFLHDRKNNIQIGGKPSGRFNLLYNLNSARGKYIALCEGDDYWTDPLKLQKQVEFLEENKDYSMVCTNYSLVDENKNMIQFFGWEKTSKRVAHISQKSILERYTPQLLTVMLRKGFLDKIGDDIYNDQFPNGDVALFAAITEFGPCYFIDEITGCYRQNRNGVWAGKKIDEQLNMKFITMKNLLPYFSHKKSAKKSIYKKLNSTTRVLSILSFKKAAPVDTFRYLSYHLYYKLKSKILSD